MTPTKTGQAIAIAGTLALFVGLLAMAGWQWALVLTGGMAMLAGAVMALEPTHNFTERPR